MTSTNAVPQGVFGPGILYLTRTDVANSTPVNVGFVNEFSYDITGETKQLFGQNDLPILTASGTKKASGKMKAATLSGIALNSVMWGGTFTASQTGLVSTDSTAIPVSPFAITPSVPSSGTWDVDLGVINASTREPLTKVASSPTAGQYSVSAGVYTFASADHSSAISVIITYAYTFTASGGQTLIYTARPIGTTPTFQIDYYTSLYGSGYYVRFFNAISNKLSMAHKLTDFAMPEIDFEFFTNASSQLYQVSLATTA